MELSPKYLDRLSPQSQSGSKWIHGEVMFILSVGEVATSKWTHGEVAVFGSTVYSCDIIIQSFRHLCDI